MLAHLMDGIVPYYGRRSDWERDEGRPKALIRASNIDLYHLYFFVLRCEEVAENAGYAQIVTIEDIKKEDGAEFVRITTEALYGNRDNEFMHVDVAEGIPANDLRGVP